MTPLKDLEAKTAYSRLSFGEPDKAAALSPRSRRGQLLWPCKCPSRGVSPGSSDQKAASAALDFFRDAGPPSSARITVRGRVISRRHRVDNTHTLALEGSRLSDRLTGRTQRLRNVQARPRLPRGFGASGCNQVAEFNIPGYGPEHWV